jgi:adenylate cyclase
MTQSMREPVVVPGWLLLSVVVVIAANLVAGVATRISVGVMQGVSEFALNVEKHDTKFLTVYRCAAYLLLTAVTLLYLWPLVRYFRCGDATEPSLAVQRRAVNGPFVIAALGFSGWVSGVILFPVITIVHFGRWTGELASQQVLSPLINGFLAATTSYLVTDWVFRTRVVPHVFPGGRATQVGGTATLGVGARLAVFLVAVAFVPLFTMLGLIRAAAVRLDSGWEVGRVMPDLVHAGESTFALYVALGIVLTALLTRTFTRPLAEVTAALRRVRAGTLDQLVRITSADEIGVLQESVNAMATTLHERERILQTFGRVVEPVVRDRLLAGDLRGEGEVRTASILFCDLKDFTTFAERTAPRELVQTLNQFFTTMTTWARSCDGFVNKFIGDGILVVFGLLDDDPTHGPASGAAAAVRCALGMRERLAQLNEDRVALGHPPLGVKIGVHTGPVVAGTIGAADRHEYTVVGDTVNVAARLEELCRDHGCEVIVSAATWDLARAGGVRLPEAHTDAVRLRGRDEAVRVYRVG